MAVSVGAAVDNESGTTPTAARQLEIAGRVIDDQSDCYVIAEIGHNHQGSVDKAKELFSKFGVLQGPPKALVVP